MTITVEELIVNKAIDHVWQKPRADGTLIVQLSRISPKNGYKGHGKVAWDIVETPTVDGYYHFYQLGDNYPGDFNLMLQKNQWYKLSDWCKISYLLLHVYTKGGKLFPVSSAYVIRLYNDNLIIALLRNDGIADLNEETVYCHFYRNSHFTGYWEDDTEAQIEYYSSSYSRVEGDGGLVNALATLKRYKQGKILTWLNGVLVDEITRDTLKDGDVTEVCYDASIRDIVDIPMKSLRFYHSTLDAKTKYLIHPPKDKINTITYRDDIDIYVCRKDPVTGEVKGLYYHRNMEDSVRMLTHRDYGIVVPYVTYLMEQLVNNPTTNDYFIRLVLRDNGPRVPIISDSGMVKSLYRLPDDKIIEAMVMVDSTVPEWTAPKLEESAYTALMRSMREELTANLALDAFGYSQTVRFIAYPNINITRDPNGDYFKLQEGLRNAVTVYEYDKNGLLLGWYYQEHLHRYYPRNKDAIFIEAIAGKGAGDLNLHVGNKPFDLTPDTAYRFYLSKKEGDKVVGDWKDVTGKSDIVIDGNRCTFNHHDTGEVGISLGDNVFLAYDIKLDGSDGILDFALRQGNGTGTVLPIPLGKIDLWLNGHALVEDIDYFVDFPNVVITCKEYLTDTPLQQVTVRANGFPFTDKGSLVRIAAREAGYIRNNMLSVDDHFDLHEDRVLRVVADGGVFNPDDTLFEEDGVAALPKRLRNGKPYAVETPYVSIQGLLNISMYQSQVKDYELHQRVTAYLSKHLLPLPKKALPAIEERYELYSPFMSRLVMDIVHGRFTPPPPQTTDQVIDKMLGAYKWLLPMDPCIRGFDDHFANVHPHNRFGTLELNPRDMAFVEKVNKLYLNGKVDFSPFIKIYKGR
nr:MAG TPA: hypothetical protein [Caudoviricetes sp.]